MKRKIAYVGAQCSAKTTRSSAIYEEYMNAGHDAGYVTETARDCPYPINENTGFKAQLWILVEQIKEEMLTAQKHDIVVCDRSVIDPIVYARNVGVDEEKCQILEEIAKPLAATYDTIYLCSPRAMYSDDFRSTDVEWQEEIYEGFKALIKKWNLRVHRI